MANVAIVGAGIIGTAIAIWLIGEGHAVTVFDADPEGLPASSGNAALIALPEITPIASPGSLLSVPGWLMDPLGPLTIHWADLPALTPWLMAFLAASVPARVAAGRQALAGLMRTALDDHEQLQAKAGAGEHLRQLGSLNLHDSAASLAAGREEAERVKTALAFDYDVLTPEAARRLVPQLEGKFAGAIHQPAYRIVSNPLTMLRDYQAVVRERGTLTQGRVVRLDPQAGAIGVALQSGGTVPFDRVVVAAGVWSRELVRQLGLNVLLETERGYNTTFNNLGWNLAMPVTFADHGFVASPLVDGLRVGGAVELAQPQTEPNFERAAAMRQKMRRYVPALPDGGREWMGRRPSTPDSLPVIAPHPRDGRIVFAFGHGHLGLTLSGVTARLVAGLIAGTSAQDIKAFDIQRFQ